MNYTVIEAYLCYVLVAHNIYQIIRSEKKFSLILHFADGCWIGDTEGFILKEAEKKLVRDTP